MTAPLRGRLRQPAAGTPAWTRARADLPDLDAARRRAQNAGTLLLCPRPGEEIQAHTSLLVGAELVGCHHTSEALARASLNDLQLSGPSEVFVTVEQVQARAAVLADDVEELTCVASDPVQVGVVLGNFEVQLRVRADALMGLPALQGNVALLGERKLLT